MICSAFLHDFNVYLLFCGPIFYLIMISVPADPRIVIVEKLALISDGRPDLELDLLSVVGGKGEKPLLLSFFSVLTLRMSKAAIPGFAQTSLLRRTTVYRLCANFPVASEAGLPVVRYVNARRRKPVYQLCFLMHTGT